MFNSLRIVTRNESKQLYLRMMNGEKIALVGLNTEIHEWLPELETVFKSIPLFRGREQLWSDNKNWEFIRYYHYVNNQKQTELIQLIASGIYQFWKYWLRDRKYIESKLKHDLNNSVEALSLNSNVTFVYVILVFGLLSATMCFVIEIMRIKIKSYSIPQMHQILWDKRYSLLTNARCLCARAKDRWTVIFQDTGPRIQSSD